MQRRTIALAVLASLFAFPAAGGATAVRIAVAHQPVPMRPGDTVEIDNVDGPIDVGAVRGAAVTIEAEIVQNGTGRARVAVEHVGGKVTICTVYGASGGRRACGDRTHPSDTDTDGTNVAYTIGVPAGVAVVARTVDGGVTVRNARAAVDAMTVDGAVSVASTGPIAVKTVEGAVDATARASRDVPCRLETVDGAVTLRLMHGSDANVAARTLDGDIEGTGLTFARQDGTIVGHTATGKVGHGAGTVSLATVNGSIRVTAE